MREVVKHPDIKEAVLVDIDRDVIEASESYLPGWNSGFSDPRAKVVIDDGLAFVKRRESRYDVVIVDSTDPVGPGEALFTEDFYASVRRSLKPGGLFAAQTENPLIMPEVVRTIFRRIAGVFPSAGVYTAPVPTYPGGWWSFTCGSLGPDPGRPSRKPGDGWDLRYYSPEIHERAFVLSPGMKRDLA